MEPSVRIAIALLLWWCLSIAITIALKIIFTSAFLAFPYPFFVSGVINVVAALVAGCYVYFLSVYTETTATTRTLSPFDTAPVPSRRFSTLSFSRADWMQILAIGVVNGLELGAANYFLKLLPMATRQMTHAVTPAFMLLMTVAFRLEALTCELALIMVVMSLGSLVSSIDMIQEDAFGMGAIVHSPSMSVLFLASLSLYGVKWSCTQKLLQGHHARTMSPVLLFAYTSPVTAVGMLIIAFLIEGQQFWGPAPPYAQNSELLRDMALCSIFASVAVGVCIMAVAENALVKYTSALSISVFASVHNLLIVLSGVIAFGDKITAVSLAGYAVNQVGVAAYAYMRRQALLRCIPLDDTSYPATSHPLLGEHQ